MTERCYCNASWGQSHAMGCPLYDANELCPSCHQRKHGRIMLRQASHPEPEERPSLVKIAGLTVFMLALFAVIAYAMPIIGEAALR